MRPELIFTCIAIIAVGVAVIMYTLFRSSKPSATIGMGSSIDLGDEVPDKEAEEETEVTDEQESAAEMQNEEEDA
jgi:hypothetical protein